jgi:PAS domain S-box-containing protein
MVLVARVKLERRRGSEAAHLAAIVESSDDAIISKTTAGTVTSWNKAAERTFGYSADEIIGRHISMLFPPDRLGEEDQILARIAKGERVEHFETVRRRKDGVDFPVSLTISPIRNEAGAIIGASKIARDISRRHKANVALQMSENRFRQVVEACPSALVMADAAGRIELVNRQAEVMFGYSEAKLMGVSVDVLLPVPLRRQHAGLRDSFLRDPRARAMGKGRDLYAVTKDGKPIPVEVGLTPIQIDGETKVLAAIVDLTERKRGETELQKSEDRFRAIFNSVGDGIFIVDAETGSFIQGNESGAAMLGFAPAELAGLTIADLSANVPPYTMDDAYVLIERAKAGDPQRFEWHCKAKDGRLFWAEVTIGYALIGGQGVLVSTVRDITERRAVDAQLRQALKMEAIGQLTGGIAHDFNNLLAVINGNLELISESTADDPELKEMAGDALRAAGRGADLTYQLLAYSRQQPLEPKMVKLPALVDETAKLLRRTLAETIEIHRDMPADLWPTRIDPGQLQNALVNLAVNARDAMPNGGKLTIEAHNVVLDEEFARQNAEVVPGQYVRLAVSDNGAGIPRDVIDRVLEPFFTTKPVGKGSGLGLSMVFGFVKQSGGHVKIYSEVGKGTTVSLYLPKAQELGAAPAKDDATTDTAAAGDETILVVEDDPMVRKLAVRILTALGYRTLEAEDGPAALQLIGGTDTIDLLLTDVVLPKGISGADIVKKGLEQRPGLKFLYMSGYARDAAINNDLLGSGARLLNKPFPKAELALKVREALDEGIKQ